MPGHRVLIETQQQIQLVSMSEHFPIRHSHREKNVTASNDGLISIVGVQMKAPADENSGQDITGCCDALSGCTSNAQCKIKLSRTHRVSPPYFDMASLKLATNPLHSAPPIISPLPKRDSQGLHG